MNHESTVVFRVDASVQIGNGHVMRCLALAGALSERAVQCDFVCTPTDGNLVEFVRDNGFKCSLLSRSEGLDWSADASETAAAAGNSRPDWVIVDHYRLDHRWEAIVRPAFGRVMAIDDLANRKHNCDLLLDQNLGRSPADYRDLVPPEARLLTGPDFALLRPEFAHLRESSLTRRRSSGLGSIMISMGGTDPTNATCRLLRALVHWDGSARCRVVAVFGPQNPWVDEARALATQLPYECVVIQNPPDYASIMAQSDLCIGTAGTTSWERCCLGVPSIVASVAENQIELAERLVASGAALAVLDLNDLDGTLSEILNIAALPDVLGRASVAASALCSGQGADMVAREMLGFRV